MKVLKTFQVVLSSLGSGSADSDVVRFTGEERDPTMANMAHIRQSRPDSGVGFQVKVSKSFQVIHSYQLGGPKDRGEESPPRNLQ